MSRKQDLELRAATRLRGFAEAEEPKSQQDTHILPLVLRVIDEETIELVKSRYTKHGIYRLDRELTDGEPAAPAETEFEKLRKEHEHRLDYNYSLYLSLLERVRKLEAMHIVDLKIQCPSTNGYHRCALEVDHPGDHKGINGKEEWYAWERR